MGNIVVGQSGGPTAVINATVYGVLKEGLKHPEIKHLYGAIHGIDGVINENLFEVTKDTNLENWQSTPGAILGSVRLRLKKYPEDLDLYNKILEVFKKYDIEYFFYVGGNDSMDTCYKMDYFFKQVGYNCKVIGLPKTVDNDLVSTDHCPGYGSAAKIVSTMMAEIYHDTSVYRKGRVTIVEIMGRDAGWLTASTHLANINNNGPDLIYLPESPFDINDFISDVKALYEKKKKVLVAVSEGIVDKEGKYILHYQTSSEGDSFGHLQLGGVALVLANTVSEKLKLPVRAIELNLPQRCAAHLASLTDVKESTKCGEFGVKNALKNKSGYMVSMERVANYKIKYVLKPLEKIATMVKAFPTEWIINGNQISNEYIEYVLPLIQGESYPKFVNGLPIFARINK